MAESRFRSPADRPTTHRVAGSGGAAPARVEDPLAELARLIGQEDPFKDFYKDELRAHRRAAGRAGSGGPARPTAGTAALGQPQPPPGYGAPPAAEPAMPLRPAIDPLARRPPPIRSSGWRGRPRCSPRPRSTRAGFGQDGLRRRDASRAATAGPRRRAAAGAAGGGRAGAAGGYEDPYRRHDDDAEYDRDYGAEEQAYDPYYSEDGHMPPHGEGLGGRRRAAARAWCSCWSARVLGLAAVGTGGVFAYRALVGGGEPPTIKADAGPEQGRARRDAAIGRQRPEADL